MKGSSSWIALSSAQPWAGPSIFIGSAGRSQEEDVKAFSELEAANRQEEVLRSLQILEPRLRRLSILLLADEPAIHGDIGLSRLVPLQFMGEGMRRVISIIAAIASARRGSVLIDEIENGLHYSIMKDVWTAIAKAARQADVQVFATTHSWECIVAANESFSKSDSFDLAMHRLDRRDKEIRIVTYDREALAAAIKHELEVR